MLSEFSNTEMFLQMIYLFGNTLLWALQVYSFMSVTEMPTNVIWHLREMFKCCQTPIPISQAFLSLFLPTELPVENC